MIRLGEAATALQELSGRVCASDLSTADQPPRSVEILYREPGQGR